MSLRIILCVCLVLFFSIYAWKNWFSSLCAAVVLMAVVEHPDFQEIKNIGGITGLNPWNFLLLNVIAGWLLRKRNFPQDFPSNFKHLMLLFILTILFGFLRLAANNNMELPLSTLCAEYFINTLKWIIPGYLLFDGCRSIQQVKLAILSILLLYIFLAVQVIFYIPLEAAVASGKELSILSYRRCQNSVGYNRVTLSMMLGGASWAIVTCIILFTQFNKQFLILIVAIIVGLGQALTGGRSGYVSWLAVGLVICYLRWKLYLFVVPLLITILLIFLPSVQERLLMGVKDTSSTDTTIDLYTLTSGRNLAWPYVINYITKSPILGYGRQAMLNEHIDACIMNDNPGESFPHPHNAYLEFTLDNGLIGLFVILCLFGSFLSLSLKLFTFSGIPIVTCVGGIASSLLLALLVGAFGGQTFYPREGAVGMWASIGLMLRMSVELEHLKKQIPSFLAE